MASNTPRQRELRRCLELLQRYRNCDERREAADMRGRRHPGTSTMDREFALSDRWNAKAEAAWDEAIGIIHREMEG